MFIITLTYIKPIEMVDKYLVEHRSYLEQGYQKNYFIASGPKTPRTGGIIISQLTDKEKVMRIMEQDPFYLNGIAEFDIVEFTPVKYHENFSHFIK